MWTLILLVYAGAFADTDSVAITQVPNFINEQHCQAAGVKAEALVTGTKKDTSFICVRLSTPVFGK